MPSPSLLAASPRRAVTRSRRYDVIRRIVGATLGALLAVASGCSGPHHPGWVVRSTVEVAGPLPAAGYRLVFPYIVGDLYGSPNTGSFVTPVSQSPGELTLDLNRTQQALESELGPAEFSLRFLKIAPAGARFARLTPVALQRNGIEPVGPVEWLDAQSRKPLMLVYIDRPAQIEGSFTRSGETIRYDIRAARPGYVWIGTVPAGAHETLYRAMPPPQRLILRITVQRIGRPTRTPVQPQHT